MPVETLISEYAPGQYELTLHYRKDVLRAADDLVLLKRLVRVQARRHGVTACFMAKPIERYAGSGMHFHVSMPTPRAATSSPRPARRRLGAGAAPAIGGLAATMAESMLVFAPHANSWRRFVAQSYAPLAPTWGVNNRSVALRIPAGDADEPPRRAPPGRRRRQSLSGRRDGAGRHRQGARRRDRPGAETTGNGYETPPGWTPACRPTGARRSRRPRRRLS